MPETPAIFVLNGPNLNLLGVREPDIYGYVTLDDIRSLCEQASEGFAVDFRQTNHEGEMIDWIHEAREKAAAVVINAAGYTHTSVALLDALKTLAVPVIECHLSNPAAREAYRHHSYVSPVATGIVSGFGPHSYELAIKAALRLMQKRDLAATVSPQG